MTPVNVTATGTAFSNGTDTITTAGVYPVTLEVTDLGGNMVSSTGNVSVSLANVQTVLANAGITGIRTSSTGSDVSTVTIPTGTGSLTIYVEASSNLVATPTALSGLGSASISSAVLNATAKTVTITFNESINTSTITAAGLDTALALGAHTWGTNPTLAWSNNNTVLTVTLGTTPTVATGDTITPAAGVTSTYGAVVSAGTVN